MFLTPREAATVLCLSVRTLSKYRSAGKGPVYYKLGASVRYTLDDLRRWAESRTPGRESDRAGPPLEDEESLKPRPGPR